jgi:curved DNA-binding protein
MNYKDYYKVLGVSETATSAEIRKAYHKLAIQYHPDKTKGDRAAEEKFKAINEANEVLNDADKRKKYDRLGVDWKHYKEAGAQSGGFDWSKYANERGRQTHHMSSEEFNTMFAGEGVGDLFELLFGQQNGQRGGRRKTAYKGEDLEAEIKLSLEEVYLGTIRLIQLNGQKIRVTIKAGTGDQQILRIAGKGGAGVNGGPGGDLYVTISIASHRQYQRKGNDLYCDLQVELYTAVLGGKSQLKTLKGMVKVDIPKEIPNGTTLRLNGLGMPIYSKKNEFGSLFVRVVIQMPKHLSEQEIDLFKKLKALRN